MGTLVRHSYVAYFGLSQDVDDVQDVTILPGSQHSARCRNFRVLVISWIRSQGKNLQECFNNVNNMGTHPPESGLPGPGPKPAWAWVHWAWPWQPPTEAVGLGRI